MLGVTTITVSRPGADTFLAGELTPGAATVFTIQASVQPLSGVEREDLPEGYRTRGRFKMYQQSGTVLQTTNLTTGQREDTVTYKGRSFEVVAWQDWTDHAGPTGHSKFILAEIGVDE